MYFPEQDPNQRTNEPETQEPKRKGGRGWKVTILCLCCVLLGGVVGFGGSVVLGMIRTGEFPVALYQQTEVDEMPIVRPEGNILHEAKPEDKDPEPEEGAVVTGALTPSQVYAKNVDACVGITVSTTTNIYGYTTTAAATGSGFVVTEDGYIVTNHHVIEKAAQNKSVPIAVTFRNGDSYKAKLIGSDEDHDVAVLKIQANGLTAVTVGDSDKLVVGEAVYAIGNPLGELTYTLTDGLVSARDRVITMGSGNDATSMNMLQTNCAINPGNSGGPLFNGRGEVIGITTAKMASGNNDVATVEGLGFAIPINDVKSIINDLAQHGYITGKPYMGVMVSSVTAADAQRYNLQVGAYVESIEEGSCAERAGLQVGDIITAIDDTIITTHSALVATKSVYRAGDTVVLKVVRGNEAMELQLTFDEMPPELEQSQTGNQQPQYGNPYGGSGQYDYYFGWPFFG